MATGTSTSPGAPPVRLPDEVPPPMILLALLAVAGVGAFTAVAAYAFSPWLPVAVAAVPAFAALAWFRPGWAVGAAFALAPLEPYEVALGLLGDLTLTKGALLIVAGAHVLRLASGRAGAGVPRPGDWPVALLLAALLPGLLLGVPAVTVVKLLVMWVAFAIVLLAVRGLPRGDREVVVVGLAVGATVMAVQGLEAYLSSGGTTFYGGIVAGRTAAGITDPNYYATYLHVATVPLAALLIGGLRPVALRPFAWGAVAVTTVAILLSFSRSATLALALSVVLLALGWRSARRTAGLLAAIVLAGVVLVGNPLAGNEPAADVGRRLTSITQPDASEMRGRLWAAAIEVTVERPWGIGALEFRREAGARSLTEEGWPMSNVHNTYLNLAVELGVVGLLAFLAWMTRIGRDLLPSLRRSASPRDRALAVGIGAALAGHLLALVFLSAYQVQIVIAVLFVLAGLASALPGSQSSASRSPGSAATSTPAVAQRTPA
jgi:O-antigen ligase